MPTRVLIFVVCYNAEEFIQSVLGRIPPEILSGERFHTEVLVIDDQSTDRTFYEASDCAARFPGLDLTVLYNPKNLGYGGNQKIGYHYAIRNDFDVVVLLHGDGQYAPELLGEMIGPILEGEADVVLGSRMIRKRDALKGRMPLYRWVGNQILTYLQNRILGCRLAEFHTGYRAFSVAALESIPFACNSDYFDFDTDILIQLLDTGKRIREIPIPTFYGTEVSRVNGFRYAALILLSCILSRVTRLGILYHPKFDYASDNTRYAPKLGFASSHEFALDHVREGTTVVDVGCGPGFMAAALTAKGARVISIDAAIQPETRRHSVAAIEADLEEYDFGDPMGGVDTVLVLDVLEHLRSPESLLRKLRERFSRDCPDVVITTGNVGFFVLRLSLLLGQFNYGRRGILDLTHTRLFTFASLRRLLLLSGFEVVETRGIPAPFPLAVGNGRLGRFLLWANGVLIRLSKSLFAYQIAMVTRPRPTLSHLLQDARDARDRKLEEPKAAGAHRPS